MLAARTVVVALAVFAAVWVATDRLRAFAEAWRAATRRWEEDAWLRAQCADATFALHMARDNPLVCARVAERATPLREALRTATGFPWPMPSGPAVAAVLLGPAAAHAGWRALVRMVGRRVRRVFKQRDLFL
jgi:hypothetical protein